MWRTKAWRVFGTFGMLLLSGPLAGCGFLHPLTEQDVVGTYEADADWGKSILVLHPDHSFSQTVLRGNHSQTSITGTWKLRILNKRSSSGLLVLMPYLDMTHDGRGDRIDGALPSVGRDLLWGIHISADPDWGITFEKE